jgi:hypothetical protein
MKIKFQIYEVVNTSDIKLFELKRKFVTYAAYSLIIPKWIVTACDTEEEAVKMLACYADNDEDKKYVIHKVYNVNEF